MLLLPHLLLIKYQALLRMLLFIEIHKNQNKILWLAALGALMLTTLVIYLPIFHFEPIQWHEYLIAVGLALTIIPIVEIIKWIQRCISKK